MKGLITTTPAKPAPRTERRHLQRSCACGNHTLGGSCDECSKNPEKKIQRSRAGVSSVSPVPRIVSEVLQSPGLPLDASARSAMESHFDFDFSSVRVHTDARAAESAAALNARAYTSGDEIVFGAGYYALSTAGGRHL